jgi:hypothetical protein
MFCRVVPRAANRTRTIWNSIRLAEISADGACLHGYTAGVKDEFGAKIDVQRPNWSKQKYIDEVNPLLKVQGQKQAILPFFK